MGFLAIPIFLISLLLPRTAAQSEDSFDAPPLEVGVLAIYAILLVATLVQLGFAFSYPCRGHSPHLAPGAIAIIAFLILAISYALGAVQLVLFYFDDDFGDTIISGPVSLSLQTATNLFADWSDPLVLLAVVYVLCDRYKTYDGKGPDATKPSLPLLPFTIILHLLAVLMFALSCANRGLFQATITAAENGDIPFDEVDGKIKVSNNIFYAFNAMYVLATIILIPLAIVVKKVAKANTITNLTSFGIVPLLCLHALARMIFIGILSHPPTSLLASTALDLAIITVEGFLYLGVTSILCYFFMSIRLWNGPGDQVAQQYGGYVPQPLQWQQGMQPIAQFPGQWGYPGNPQGHVPQQLPYHAYPLPQGATYYPNQQAPTMMTLPTASGEERVRDAAAPLPSTPTKPEAT